ncbi:MAG: VWA domain-containing protein [Deltaproteobacteria bacterium]|nr:MAG: VWA domain-containing protein [Deltaproteobacteria bacterium]
MLRFALPFALVACAPEYGAMTSTVSDSAPAVSDSLPSGESAELPQVDTLEACAQPESGVPFTPVEVNVHILLDISSSMTGERWDELLGFGRQLKHEDPSARIGLSMFPVDGYCGAGEPVVVAGEYDDSLAVSDAVYFTRPAGATPMGAAIDALVGRPELQTADRDHAVLLITDGVESCDGDPADAIRALVSQEQAVSLRIMGIGTFAHTEAALQELADLAAPTTSNTDLLTAATGDEVRALFDEMSTSCRFEVDEPVSEVELDGASVGDFSYDPVLGQVQLSPASCEAYRESPCKSLAFRR